MTGILTGSIEHPGCSYIPGEQVKLAGDSGLHIAEERTLEHWFGTEINIYIVTRKVSSNLLVIDFDEPLFYETWLERAGERTKGLVVQKTGKGLHVLFRCPEPGINQKLAFVKDEQEVDGRRIAIETRGEGG